MNTAKKVDCQAERKRKRWKSENATDLTDFEEARARITYTLTCEADDIITSSDMVKDFRSSLIADA